ncbi:MAG: metal ABC transporter ATP-binding protein [Candidatus Gracilibacteria bacterium]|nr:metal ABC transporter ATP-binding protein [Candidatus Gracilibacteria bacterium]
MTKIIDLKDISFSYTGKKNIFSHLNTQVNKGDFIGVLGENGSGKTTLIKLILGLLNPSKGIISWYNDKSEIISKSKLNIEYISQKAQMIDNIVPITVKEIVKMGNKSEGGIGEHFRETCGYETIESALKHTNMFEFINTPFSNLSGGQKQRVLIAKALISNPDIIIMDEPTAGVDLVAQKHFYDLLSHLNEVHNITIILISHDTKFIQEKIKRLWYLGNNDCFECTDTKKHLLNIETMFKGQEIEFF